METSYIYSSSRIKALEKGLLTEADMDNLLSAKTKGDAMRVLKETPLSAYVSGDDLNSLRKSLDKNLVEVKRLIDNISPVPNLMDFWWFRYDFHNLRVLLRMKKLGLSIADVEPFLSRLGKYTPEEINEHINLGTLERLEIGLKNTYESALRTLDDQGLVEAEMVIDKGYFSLAKEAVDRLDLDLLKKVLVLEIDLHNLKSRLRTLTVNRGENHDWFIEGGSFDYFEIETKELALARLSTYKDEKFWKEAIELYLSSDHSTLIDVKCDELLLRMISEWSHDMFSPVSLLAYFLKQKNMALNVQAIMANKENGQNEEVIRQQLRNIYV